MKKGLLIIPVLVLVLQGCTQKPADHKIEKVAESDSIRIADYIQKNFNWADTVSCKPPRVESFSFDIEDTLYIKSLNTTLYRISHEWSTHPPTYHIALDHGDGAIYHWHPRVRQYRLGSDDYYTQEQHEMVLEQPQMSFVIFISMALACLSTSPKFKKIKVA